MDVMDSDSQLAFLWRIIKATESGSVEWSKNDEQGFCYETRIGKFSYLIESVDGDDVAPHAFRIFRWVVSSEGKNEPTQVAEWVTGSYSPLNDPLQELYVLVKRKVLGYIGLAAEMFASLAELDGGPPTPDVADPFSPDESPADEPPF